MTTATQDEARAAAEARVKELQALLAQARQTAFTEISRARHATALAKVPHVIDHLTACLEEGPVVCMAHHKDVIAKIAEAFPGRCVTLTGDTPMDARQAAVDAFQAGKVDLFIGNIQAAGVGITLTRSAHVVFAELDWVPGNLSQAEDRCHRIGQTESVLVQHVVLEDSLDAEMARKLIRKQEVITGALDTVAPKPAQAAQAAPAADSVEIKERAVAVTPDPRDAAAAALSPEQITAVHTCLRMLSGVCDGAMELDGCGFNKFDSRFGKALAAEAELTPRQALIGQRMVRKYRRQLPDELLNTALGKEV